MATVFVIVISAVFYSSYRGVQSSQDAAFLFDLGNSLLTNGVSGGEGSVLSDNICVKFPPPLFVVIQKCKIPNKCILNAGVPGHVPATPDVYSLGFLGHSKQLFANHPTNAQTLVWVRQIETSTGYGYQRAGAITHTDQMYTFINIRDRQYSRTYHVPSTISHHFGAHPWGNQSLTPLRAVLEQIYGRFLKP